MSTRTAQSRPRTLSRENQTQLRRYGQITASSSVRPVAWAAASSLVLSLFLSGLSDGEGPSRVGQTNHSSAIAYPVAFTFANSSRSVSAVRSLRSSSSSSSCYRCFPLSRRHSGCFTSYFCPSALPACPSCSLRDGYRQRRGRSFSSGHQRSVHG